MTAAVQPLLNQPQLAQFARDGYIVIPSLLDSKQTAGVRDMLRDLILELTARSRVSETDEIYRRSVPPEQRKPVVQFERGIGPADDAGSDPLDRVRKVMNFQRREPVASLSAVAERAAAAILGPRPILLHCLSHLKPPAIGGEKRWHQDNAYFSVAPLDAVVGIWIALHDTDPENGCLHVVRGGHHLGPIRHMYDVECCIAPESLPAADIAAVAMREGDAILFHGLLPHSSPPNRSPRRRWSLTFHYRSCGSKVLPNADFAALFLDRDGNPAGCAAAARRASPALELQWRY